MFFHEFYVDTKGDYMNYFYDVETTLTPYDENYPLTATRESFKKNEQAHWDFSDFANKLRYLLDEAMTLQEMKKHEIREFSPGLFVSGDITYKQIMKAMKDFNIFKEQVIKVLSLMELNINDYQFILTSDDANIISLYSSTHNAFSWNANHNSTHTKAEILEVAVHEVTHIWEMNHYESFTIQNGIIWRRVLSAIVAKEIRI
jgi:hypothetical protein